MDLLSCGDFQKELLGKMLAVLPEGARWNAPSRRSIPINY